MQSPHTLTLILLLSVGALSLARSAPAEPRSTDLGREEQPSRSLSWVDFDADGRPDVCAIQPDGTIVLLRNNENGVLEESTLVMGLGALTSGISVAHAVWEDVDQDSFPELLVVTRSGGVQLFENVGGRELVDISLVSGLTVTGAVEAGWSDVDRDGLLDLVLVTTGGVRLQRNLGELTFAPSSGEDVRAPGTNGVLVAPGKSRLQDEDPAVVGTEEEAGSASAPGSAPHSALGFDAARNRVAIEAQPPSPQPGTLPFNESQLCVGRIEDDATSNCIKASSVPGLGKLYPITSDLYVDAVTGRVGINTTAPGARLGVSVAGETGLNVSAGVIGPSAAIFSTPNTSPGSPTIFALAGDGGTSGFFEEGLAIGTTFLGLPASQATFRIDASNNSELRMENTSSAETVALYSKGLAGTGAELQIGRSNGTKTAALHGEYAGRAGGLTLGLSSGLPTVILEGEESTGSGAALRMSNALLTPTIVLDAQGANAGEIRMRNSSNVETVEILSEELSGTGGKITLSNNSGVPQIRMSADIAGTGLISLRRADGTVGISLFGDVSGDGRITCDVLQITGGADLVESFATDRDCPPGSVLVIDTENPGALKLSSSPYDKRVAGVVSGAGDVRPGLHLGQPKVLQGDTPVALSGRVYVRCTDENGPIQPGDLLTSSSTPGSAMRATDSELAFGAVIGKALDALDRDTGLVLVLVSLQ